MYIQDAFYKTKKEKYHAVVEEVKAAHAKGQPVLVGTITIDVSETISAMLKREGIQHTVLNAKFHELEAEIVAAAGQHGAVTIATNMAGRGTDIKLDDDAKEAGGLKVIGTERHESRRIDNQLRGRSGRQGDPGESQFFISLEDDLMRLFGSEKLMDIFNTLGVPENEQIQHKMLTSAIEKAQTKIEGNNFGIRKNLLEYDQVMNDQREIIYAERMRVLNGENMRDVIFKMITDIVDNTVDMCISDDQDTSEWNLQELNGLLIPIIPLPKIEISQKMKKNELKQMLKEQALGIAIVFHCFMEVQVILGNIRQHSAVIFNACHTLQRQSMAGNFHYAVVTAGAAHSVQCFLQVNYVRSSVMRFGNLIVNHNIDSADQTNLIACLTQNQANNIRRGCFAVSTGHADHSQLASRIIIKIRRYQLHSLTRISNLNKSNTLRYFSGNVLHQRSNSALLGSHRQKFMSVYSCTLQADKKTAGYHRTGIGSYISNNFIGTANYLSLRQ